MLGAVKSYLTFQKIIYNYLYRQQDGSSQHMVDSGKCCYSDYEENVESPSTYMD